jgi:23S rRNA G2445 N2-methylase RlmL
MDAIDRLRSKTIWDGDCLLFTGYCDPNGYGQMSYQGKPHNVHRLHWILVNRSIANGLRVLHKCDRPSCVNLDHLFLGTQQDNMDDMISKNRQFHVRGQHHGKAMFTDQDVIEIRKLIAQEIPLTEIASKYKVYPSVICRIKSGKTWSHV